MEATVGIFALHSKPLSPTRDPIFHIYPRQFSPKPLELNYDQLDAVGLIIKAMSAAVTER